MLESLKKLCLPMVALGLVCCAGVGCVDSSGNKVYPRGDGGFDVFNDDGGAASDDAPAVDAPAADAPKVDAPAGDTAAADAPIDTSSADIATDRGSADGVAADTLTTEVRVDSSGG